MTRPRLHVVALSHLDTQWRWTVRDTVERFLPATVEANERLFERFPRYVLSFEGAWRYRLLAEHHPAHFETVRRRVAEGRWVAAGAAVEAFDTLLPSPESIARQILYGRRWLRRELGAESVDLFLPDCFGFPHTLPTIAVHFGVVGFSTQKLRRGALLRAARPIPFPYGRWRGPDGSELLAALDPGEYSGRLSADPTRDAADLELLQGIAASGAPPVALRYVGIGDRGGAIPEEAAARIEAALDGDGPLAIRHGGSDRIYAETTDSERESLPVYDGELLLRLHGTGCYTAKAALKRWSRRAEAAARAAEAAVVAAQAAGHPAPLRRLEEAWTLLLAHQMHDDLTGTAIPAAYDYSFADLGLAINEFEEIFLDAIGRAATTLDAGRQAPSLIAFATHAAPHSAVVEIDGLPEGAEAIVDADGGTLRVQRLAGGAALVEAAFRGAELQVLRFAPGPATSRAQGVEAGEGWLESERYRLELDGAGALASLVDKRLDRELLAAPAALELLPDRSSKYPAWEIRWEDVASPPRAHVDRLAGVRVVERGPLRGALAVERRARGVTVRETWRLAAGEAGDVVAADVELDWRRRSTLLKAAFRLAASNPEAAYDTGLGAIHRPVSSASLYEVPAQHWAAIEDASGAFGVALFADCRHGWDHPDERTLRSTWIHAPRASFKWRHQATQDFGRHRLRFGIAGLGAEAVARGEVAAIADRFVHLPRALRFDGRGTPGGPRRRTLVSFAAPLRLLALKPAESGNGVALRVANPANGPHPIRVESEIEPDGRWIRATGMEEAVADAAPLNGGGLATLLTGSTAARGAPEDLGAETLALPWNIRAVSRNGERASGSGFDGRGRFLPRELVPARLTDTVVPFDLTHVADGDADALTAAGQTIGLPEGAVEVWLLAASADGEIAVEFAAREAPFRVVVPDWRQPLLANHGRRTSRGDGAGAGEDLLRRPTAWSCGHLHDRSGRDVAVERAVLFALRIPVGDSRRLRFPGSGALRVLAATATRSPARPVTPADSSPS